MKERIKNILWCIGAFLHQPIVPTVSIDYILKNDCSYIANDFMTDDYVLYWDGDLKKGREVKVKAIDIARYEYNRCYLDTEEAVNKADHLLGDLYKKVKAVETHDLGENLVKNEILGIIRGDNNGKH